MIDEPKTLLQAVAYFADAKVCFEAMLVSWELDKSPPRPLSNRGVCNGSEARRSARVPQAARWTSKSAETPTRRRSRKVAAQKAGKEAEKIVIAVQFAFEIVLDESAG